MYLGRIVERGEVRSVLRDPRHPNTRSLLAAVPVADPRGQRPVLHLDGDLPSPVNPPAGCHFHPRCAIAEAACAQTYPEERAFGDAHRARCHLAR
jgi:peptide/nickel transport system ATP-binding protein